MPVVAMMALGLALAAEPAADDAKKPPYTLDVQGTTKQCKAGSSGVFALHIKPAEGYYIHPKAPLKIKLDAKGLALKKSKLGRKDAKDAKSKAPRFEVSFGAKESGDHSIGADATFFVCSADICERKTAKLQIPVKVDP